MVVSRQAIFIVTRGRVRFVQREPFLGLLDAVVMKFVVHAASAQRGEKVAPDIFRELAAVNRD